MLTKNLLRFTRRSNRIYPHYIKPDDASALKFIRELSLFYGESVGQSVADLHKNRDMSFQSAPSFAKAFFKLADDSCRIGDDDGSVETLRWKLIALSKELRHRSVNTAFYEFEDFKKDLPLAAELDWADLQKVFYADLPEKRRVEAFEAQEPSEMIHRYNAAQVQGLLLHARSINVQCLGLKIAEKRSLVQKLKFHRLLAEIDVKGPELHMNISGPMSISDGSQGYGARLANYFPYLLGLPSWSLSAQVRMDRIEYSLILDSKKNWKSHYKSVDRYLPEDLESFLDSFNKRVNERAKGDQWLAVPGGDFINLGQKSFCFPDIRFERSGKKPVHMEIFHRWHKGQLSGRLSSLLAASQENYLLAVCKSIKLDPSAESVVEKLESQGIGVVRFSSFPSVRAVLSYLDT